MYQILKVNFDVFTHNKSSVNIRVFKNDNNFL
jgi:hypothetical protein